MTALAAGSRAAQAGGEGRSTRRLGLILALAALAGGLAAGALAVSDHAAALLALPLVVLPVVLWRRPDLGPFVLIFTALTVEQSPYMIGTRNGAITDRIPLFRGLGQSTHVNPADILVLLMIAICLVKRQAGPASRVHTAIRPCMLGLLGAVVLGFVVGQAHGGDLRTSLTEIRPYAYLAAAYFLAASLATSRTSIRAALWAFVLGSGIKAVQGVELFLSARNMDPRPEAILGHEEALFFGLFIFLTIALWLWDVKGALRTTATLLLPVVLVADMANSRRTAWLILGAGLVVMAVIGYACLPGRRRVLARIAVVMSLAAAVYLPIYWNHTGTLAQPARAIHSAISPSERDAASDLYRVQENANLRLNIRQGGILGKGFGVPIDYALPIVDISSIDPLIKYIPHDGVLYIFVRMGVLGAIAMWALLAAGIITAGRLVRSSDRWSAVVGAVLACGLIAYALQGYNDQGFFFYRIAFVIGTLLGLSEACLRLQADPAPERSEPAAIAPAGSKA